MSVMMIAFAVGQTAAPIIAASKAASAATDFFAVIDAPKPTTMGLREPEASAQEDIVLDSVTFAYPGRPHVKVLDELSICFQSGKITAIVGASGSGKSTIVGLLQRWYELDDQSRIVIPKSAIKPKKVDEDSNSGVVEDSKDPAVSLSGTVSVGGQNLDTLDLKWWRSQIGLVQQEPFIFNDTIFKNVEYGLIGSQWENEDAQTKKRLVEQACREAFADEFITRLPLVGGLFCFYIMLDVPRY
jgi:ATP-binding cassette subfamily B (MDR/TAP) protein 1